MHKNIVRTQMVENNIRTRIKFSPNDILKECRKEIIKTELVDYGWFGQSKRAMEEVVLKVIVFEMTKNNKECWRQLKKKVRDIEGQ